MKQPQINDLLHIVYNDRSVKELYGKLIGYKDSDFGTYAVLQNGPAITNIYMDSVIKFNILTKE